MLFISLTIYSCSDNFFNEAKIDNEAELEAFNEIQQSSYEILHKKLKNLSNGSEAYLAGPDQIKLMSEEELVEIVEPVVESGQNLLSSYGVTDEEIIEEFGSLDSPDIATAALVVARLEKLANEGYTIEGFDESDFVYASLFGNSAFAHQSYDCLLEAVGIAAVIELAKGGLKSLGKKAVMKVVRKVASRTLGWVGAAIATYEFGECMGWWEIN